MAEKEMTYEEKVQKLDEILTRLDNSETPIDKLSEDVKLGAKLIKELSKKDCQIPPWCTALLYALMTVRLPDGYKPVPHREYTFRRSDLNTFVQAQARPDGVSPDDMNRILKLLIMNCTLGVVHLAPIHLIVRIQIQTVIPTAIPEVTTTVVRRIAAAAISWI